MMRSWSQVTRRECLCAGHGGCRCSTDGSRWASPPPSSTATFDDTGEIGRYRRSSGSASRVARAVRANAYSSRKLGWGRYRKQIAQRLGSSSSNPWSSSFARSVARWQRRSKRPATGVITPQVWEALRALLARSGASSSPQPPAPATPTNGAQDAGGAGWAAEPEPAPPPAEDEPAAADPAEGDDPASEIDAIARWRSP